MEPGPEERTQLLKAATDFAPRSGSEGSKRRPTPAGQIVLGIGGTRLRRGFSSYAHHNTTHRQVRKVQNKAQ